MEQDITVNYGDSSITIDIEDLSVDVLVEQFELSFRPSSLFLVENGSKKVILISKKDKFVPGKTYNVPARRESPASSRESASSAVHNVVAALTPSSTPRPKKAKTRLWEERGLAEVVQNAVMCSKAVYYDTELECDKFLMGFLQDHNLSSVVRSRHGMCSFLIAKESGEKNRIYISFRGTHTSEDWKDNLKAYQIEGSGSSTVKLVQGKFHSGFLNRASLFPVREILSDEEYKGKEIVVCGHSLGGAVATIVAVNMMVEAERRRNAGFDSKERVIKCVTFGAPLVGNRELREFCNREGISENLFHFVSDGDPVPRLLSYAQILSSMSAQLDNQVRSLMSTFSTKEGTSFYEEKKQTWIQQKQHYVDVLGKIIPALEPILDVASFACPSYAPVLATAKLGTVVVQDVLSSTRNIGPRQKENVYVNIGNYLFLTAEENASALMLEFHEDERIVRCFEMSLEAYITDTIKDVDVYHSVDNYRDFVGRWGGWAGAYNEFYTTVILIGHQPVEDVKHRTVRFVEKFQPKVTSAELVRVQSRNNDILRLRITGFHLFNIVLDKCQFNFGFPFGNAKDKVVVKKMTLGTDVERVIFEEQFTEPPSISDHGTTIVLATLFGDNEYLMTKDQIRNLVIPNVNQISHHDSISVLVKRAIQRGMAIAQVRRSFDHSATWKPANEKIIQEIMRLGSITLEKAYFEELCRTFDNTSKSIQFVLSNETEFQKIQKFCDKMQEYLRNPLRISAEKSIAKKLGIGAATLLGGATLAYVAGPGMVVIGMVEAASMSAAGIGGAVGSIGAGLATLGYLTDKMVDENYEQVLNFVTAELFKKLGGEADSEEKLGKIQEVSDLREDGGMYSLERALLVMYDQELGVDNFKGCDLEKCTEESKLVVIKRIECIRTVHSIRSILAKQCYIGVVGLQDSGKTTFLHKVWGVGGKTGHFEHTDVPSIYEVDRRVLVVDFPGSNSLDYHARTFSICGAMNNLIVVIIPYTGDISELVSKEVSKVFEVMAGSESSQIILCVNKCGYELPNAIRNELADKEDPVDYLRARFATRLNEHYESKGLHFTVQKERIFFTDWMVGDRPDVKALGICGAERIKEEIKGYLVSNNVFEGLGDPGLRACFERRGDEAGDDGKGFARSASMPN